MAPQSNSDAAWQSFARKMAPDFLMSDERMRSIARAMDEEMSEGLRKAGLKDSIMMLPSYVRNRPTGRETGTYLALDLGGTNFRVVKCTMANGAITSIVAQKFAVPSHAQTGTAENLFDFLADCIETFMNGHGLSTATPLAMGFTFSFPCSQTAIDKGTLIHWTKGYKTSGCEGQDVVALLRAALARRKIAARVVSLSNDTVGTLVALMFDDPNCVAGLIAGTGTNIAMWERMANITKLHGSESAKSRADGEMIINTEWGAFDQKCQHLPTTMFDDVVDRESLRPGVFRFEKLVAGLYMGELARNILCHAINIGAITNPLPGLRQKGAFTSAFAQAICDDHSTDLRTVQVTMKQFTANGEPLSIQDLSRVREICVMVTVRAARILAAGIYCVVSRSNRKEASIAIDGAVFEWNKTFAAELNQCVQRLVAPKGIQVKLKHSPDGSGKGAALIAALTAPALKSKL